MRIGLRYDLRASEHVPHPDVYAAALDQCAAADRAGLDYVRLNEHHGADDGYCPSPIVVAAAIAARTARVQIRLTALLAPLHDPLRLAEDIAVADLISRGRVEVVLGAGYVPSELAMFGTSSDERVARLEETIEVLKTAWTGEPFEHRGRPARITPRPHQRPRPRLLLAGSSPGAARRAARLADGFEPTVAELGAVYEAELARLGRTDAEPRARLASGSATKFLHVAEDPEAAWEQVAPHALAEMRSYARWTAGTGTRAPYRDVASVDELRRSGVYRVVTPEECVAFAEEQAAVGAPVELHPAMGGLSPEVGWSSLQLFLDAVLPELVCRRVWSPSPSPHDPGALP